MCGDVWECGVCRQCERKSKNGQRSGDGAGASERLCQGEEVGYWKNGEWMSYDALPKWLVRHGWFVWPCAG